MSLSRFAGMLALVGLVVCLALLVVSEPALAGPGGRIARAVFESFWGRVAFGVLVIIFAPLILWILLSERRAKKRARSDLAFMARHSPLFEPLALRQRAEDCIRRIHAAWSEEDVSEARQWMTDWYWQNQQLVYLDKWKREGLVNVCNVRKIKEISPILFVHRNDGAEHEGSMIVMLVSIEMQDYLAERDTGRIVEGSKKFKDVYTNWTFTLKEGRWLVSNIEDSQLMEYIRMAKELPPIEATLLPSATSAPKA